MKIHSQIIIYFEELLHQEKERKRQLRHQEDYYLRHRISEGPEDNNRIEAIEIVNEAERLQEKTLRQARILRSDPEADQETLDAVEHLHFRAKELTGYQAAIKQETIEEIQRGWEEEEWDGSFEVTPEDIFNHKIAKVPRGCSDYSEVIARLKEEHQQELAAIEFKKETHKRIVGGLEIADIKAFLVPLLPSRPPYEYFYSPGTALPVTEDISPRSKYIDIYEAYMAEEDAVEQFYINID